MSHLELLGWLMLFLHLSHKIRDGGRFFITFFTNN